jgi:membrane-bound lytic murein transglycosylase A
MPAFCRWWRAIAGAWALGIVAGCASPPSPPRTDSSSGVPTAPSRPGLADPGEGVRWVRTSFAELPGWTQDRQRELWPALLNSCARPAAVWREWCARAALQAPADDAAARRLLQDWLEPWRLQSADGGTEGLATGYFDPELDASRERREGFTVAVHGPPRDLALRRPHFTRQELDTLPLAQASVAGRELAWLSDPVDLLLLQIQGSGRLRIHEPDGRVSPMRLAFAGHNAQPYRSPGRWLLEQGELRGNGATWGAIRAWALHNPDRVRSLLWANPRMVYFRLEPLLDPALGPRGAQGVPLTPMRSVAVDPRAVPYGTPVWISTRDPLNDAPLQRAVVAQDTGAAIVGAVRIDLFTGWGDQALVLASRLRQPLFAWVLWPKGADPPPGVPSP